MKGQIKIFGMLVLALLLTFCENEPSSKPAISDFKILSDTVEVDSIELGTELRFENLSINAEKYLWNFGTNDISTEDNPIYTYDSVGLFEVTLISFGKNNLDSCIKTVQVTAPPVVIELPSYWLQKGDIENFLLAIYADFCTFTENQLLIDVSYCNFKNIGEYEQLYSHNQSAGNPKIEKLWEAAYSTLYKVSIILDKVSDGTISDEVYDTESLSAQVKVIRACVYQNLINWFGDVPLIEDGMDLTEYNSILRTSKDIVLEYIVQDLLESIEILPTTWSYEETWQAGESYKVDKNFSRGLLTEIYLAQDELNLAQQTVNEILNSSEYALSPDSTDFAIQSPEIIFACYIQVPEGVSQLFQNTFDFEFIPVMRATNILLLSTEIEYKQGNVEDAISQLNQLRERRLQVPLTVEDVNDLDLHILNQYLLELSLEGKSFLIIKRFNKAIELLDIEDYKLLLPLPFSELIINPNLSQNEGY